MPVTSCAQKDKYRSAPAALRRHTEVCHSHTLCLKAHLQMCTSGPTQFLGIHHDVRTSTSEAKREELQTMMHEHKHLNPKHGKEAQLTKGRRRDSQTSCPKTTNTECSVSTSSKGRTQVAVALRTPALMNTEVHIQPSHPCAASQAVLHTHITAIQSLPMGRMNSQYRTPSYNNSRSLQLPYLAVSDPGCCPSVYKQLDHLQVARYGRVMQGCLPAGVLYVGADLIQTNVMEGCLIVGRGPKVFRSNASGLDAGS